MYFLLLLILRKEVQCCASRSSATMKSHADKKLSPNTSSIMFNTGIQTCVQGISD